MNTGFEVTNVTPTELNKNGNGSYKTLTMSKLYLDSMSGELEVEEGAPVKRTIFSGIKDASGKLTSTNTVGFDRLVLGKRKEGVATKFVTTGEYPVITYGVEDGEKVEVSRRMVNTITSVAFRGEDPIAIANSQLIEHGVRVKLEGEDDDMAITNAENVKLAARTESRSARLERIAQAELVGGNGVDKSKKK